MRVTYLPGEAGRSAEICCSTAAWQALSRQMSRSNLQASKRRVQLGQAVSNQHHYSSMQ
jgi:hypothetical protein